MQISETSPNPAPIAPRSNPGGNIFWSVMIPTYRPNEKFLRQAIESVLQQNFSPEKMQIEVLDHGSQGLDVAALVKAIAGTRVGVFRIPKNLGIAGGFNTCIERSQGEWVHILSDDDYVLPGFYQSLEQAAVTHPEVSLLATRSFYVDAAGIITGVTGRLMKLENGGRAVDDFFYGTPIQAPGVVVRRSAYETYGGWRSDLPFTLDCEMWSRIIGMIGGLVSAQVLACYRMTDLNESSRLARTAEALHDVNRLNWLLAERYPGFDSKKATRRVCNMALRLADRYSKAGEYEAARINLAYWRRNAPASLRIRRFAEKIARCLLT